MPLRRLGATAPRSESYREMGVEGTTARPPNQLLADLTAVMRATAETSRQATLDQCRVDSAAHVERLRALAKDGGEGIRKATEDDVATIEQESKARVERVRAEAEQRIERRRELLEQELLDYKAAVDREISRVQDKVAAFEAEVSGFFEKMLEDADPTAVASMASQAPVPPPLAELDLDTLAAELRGKHEAAVRTELAKGTASDEELPPFWWLDSPAALHHDEQA